MSPMSAVAVETRLSAVIVIITTTAAELDTIAVTVAGSHFKFSMSRLLRRDSVLFGYWKTLRRQ